MLQLEQLYCLCRVSEHLENLMRMGYAHEEIASHAGGPEDAEMPLMVVFKACFLVVTFVQNEQQRDA